MVLKHESEMDKSVSQHSLYDKLVAMICTVYATTCTMIFSNNRKNDDGEPMNQDIVVDPEGGRNKKY